MEKRKFPSVYVALIIVAVICLCGFMAQSRGEEKSYVRFDGKYYYGGGATVYESVVGEEIGEIKREAPKSIFNSDGDSNFFEVGAKIYKPAPEVPAEAGDVIYVEFTRVYVHPDQTEEEKTEYALFRAE